MRQPAAPGPVEPIEFDLWKTFRTFRTSRTFTTFRSSVTPGINRQLVVSLKQVVVITFLLDVLFFHCSFLFFLRLVIGPQAMCAPVHRILLNPILTRQPVDCGTDLTEQPKSVPTAANRFGTKPNGFQSATDRLGGNPQDLAPSS